MTLRRSGFRTPQYKELSEAEQQARAVRLIERAQKQTQRAAAKRTKVMNADKLPNGWPAQYITESQFQANVESLATTLGWMHSHSHLPYFDTAGWPDLALVHKGKKRFMVRELKVVSATGRIGKPTPMQWEWLTALSDAGVDAGVWTWPFDWDRAVEELTVTKSPEASAGRVNR